jgi:hypothetical protein
MKKSKSRAACLALATGIVATSIASFVCMAAPPSNQALSKLEEADQADRNPGPNKIDWSVVAKRDAVRRDQVLQIMSSGGIQTADDYLNAAVIFQHGDSVQDTQMAYALATISLKMNPSNQDTLALKLDAWDRVMQESGKPQWYGTQYVRSKATGKWVLYPTDPDAVSDAQRKALGLPTLAEAKAREAELNKH